MTELHRKRLEKNLCIACAKIKDRDGSYCINCNAKYNALKRLGKRKLHEEGKCVTCGLDMDRVGWFCLTCSNNLRIRAKIRSAERRLNSKCVQCGIDVDGVSYCKRCNEMRMERYYRKRNQE